MYSFNLIFSVSVFVKSKQIIFCQYNFFVSVSLSVLSFQYNTFFTFYVIHLSIIVSYIHINILNDFMSFYFCFTYSFLSFCLSVFLSFCLSVFVSLCLSVFLSFCLSVFLSVFLSI